MLAHHSCSGKSPLSWVALHAMIDRRLPMEERVSKRRILIVDDHRAVLAVTRDLLKHFLGEAVDILTAETAEAALPHLRDGCVDMLVTDQRLGRGMTGLQLLATVRQTMPSLPAMVFSSGLSEEELRTLNVLNARYVQKCSREDTQRLVSFVRESLLN